MTIDSIKAPVMAELDQLDHKINALCGSPVELVNKVVGHILKNSGKRLRPLLLILMAKALGNTSVQPINFAVVIEYIHTATLLHDDVVDESALRRGQPTANLHYGNQASVLVGDYLYSKAFGLIVAENNEKALTSLSTATARIAEAEALQLMNRQNAEMLESTYVEIIHGKTGELFGVAAEIGAILGNADAQTQQAMKAFGIHLGTAFQLADDALDFIASSQQMGKTQGDDLDKGTPTLPFIYALQKTNPSDKAYLVEAISGKSSHFDKVFTILNQTGAIEYTLKKAKEQATLAADQLTQLPETVYRQALQTLANFAVERTY